MPHCSYPKQAMSLLQCCQHWPMPVRFWLSWCLAYQGLHQSPVLGVVRLALHKSCTISCMACSTGWRLWWSWLCCQPTTGCDHRWKRWWESKSCIWHQWSTEWGWHGCWSIIHWCVREVSFWVKKRISHQWFWSKRPWSTLTWHIICNKRSINSKHCGMSSSPKADFLLELARMWGINCCLLLLLLLTVSWQLAFVLVGC